ncbi:RNA polymerase [Olea europaea subsp. europaea]|uniref:RNA polymerase (Mitochondrion) n=1 Tax=Olea europaea subsp. europaea TaxID=158383 RepID=A0A8S0QVZ7_OLEEU|nr:RNA polymerase [Olea europaea subsp. europaea]
MGPPLSIINEFIYMNVIKPIVKRESDGPTEGCFASKYGAIVGRSVAVFLNSRKDQGGFLLADEMGKVATIEKVDELPTNYGWYRRFTSRIHREHGIATPLINL